MVCDTQASQDAFTKPILNSYFKEYRRFAPDSMQFLETRSEVKFMVYSDPIMVRYTSSSQDASTHQIWDSYLN